MTAGYFVFSGTEVF
uniref:Uncharacterized protein n=1 Tax=Anguilla anguilla TaxID=7936 RepID=A0A0E9SDW0_ANGAN